MTMTDAQRLIAEMEQLGMYVRLQDGSVYATWPPNHPSFGGDVPEALRADFVAHFGAIHEQLKSRQLVAAAATVDSPKSGAFNSRLSTWSAARAQRRRQALVNRIAQRDLN